MPPSPIVADLTQGVSTGDREPTTPTPVPAARPQREKPKADRSQDGPQDGPKRDKPPAGVLDMTKEPPREPRDLPARAESADENLSFIKCISWLGNWSEFLFRTKNTLF
jgi:S-DNA-T family DNA segregation ATPase FtsK/SpoIIIE